MKRGSRHLGKITGQNCGQQFHLSLPGSLASYGCRGTWQRKWQHLKSQGGQGSHNNPISCGASGAYAPGPEEEEEVFIIRTSVKQLYGTVSCIYISSLAADEHPVRN